MGFYFEKVSKNLLDAFQQHALDVHLWNGQKFIKTTSNTIPFSYNSNDIDDMFAFSSVTYILTETKLFSDIPTIYSNTNSSKVITYIIPDGLHDCFKIESGPNANRIICTGWHGMERIKKSVMPVI